MKIKVIAKRNSAGCLRLLFSYHCKSRRLFSTGVVIPASDFQQRYLEKPVLKSNPRAEHYNKQISLQFALPSITEQHYNREIKKLIRSGVTTAFEWQSYDTNERKLYRTKYLYELFTNHCCGRTAIKYFFSIGYTPDQVSRIVGKSLDTIMSYYYEEATEEDIIIRTKQFAQTCFIK